MIIKGIVLEEELERIKETIANHGLIHDLAGSLRTWKEQDGNDQVIWLEIDVNESLMEYLEQSGFFDPVLPRNRMQYRCMR